MILRQSSQPQLSSSSKPRKLKVEKIPLSLFTNQLLIAKLNENVAGNRPLSSRDNKIFQDSGSVLRKSISSSSQSRHRKTLSTTESLEKRTSDDSSETNRGISLNMTRSVTLENFPSTARPATRPSFLNFLPSEDQGNLDCPLVKRTSMVLSRESTFSRSSRRTLSSAGGVRKAVILTENTPRQLQRLSTRGSTLYTCEDTPRINTNDTPRMLKDPWQSCVNFPNGNYKIGKMKQEVMEQEAKKNFLSLNPYNSNKEREIDPEKFRPFKIQLFKPLKVVTVYKNEQQNCDPIRELTSRGNRRPDGESRNVEEVVVKQNVMTPAAADRGNEVKPKLFSIFEGQKSGSLQNLDFLSWTSPKTLSYSRSVKKKHVHWKQDNGKKLVQKYLDY